jgi:hypothetical protein
MRRGLVHGGFRPGIPGWVHAINYFQTYLRGCCSYSLTTETGGSISIHLVQTVTILCVKRNITKEYRMLPLRFQGLALPIPNIDALSKKIHLLQSHRDTGSTSGRMLHQAYQVFQVEVGLGGNIFSESFISYGRLATHGFFRNLWELLHRYGVVFCLHPNFDIPLLREQDRTLIDAVHDTGIFNRREQETLNWYRHYKGVHSIGDMVCSNGHTINLTMLTKEAGQSSRDFPLQVLTGPDHKLWLKMIHSLT